MWPGQLHSEHVFLDLQLHGHNSHIRYHRIKDSISTGGIPKEDVVDVLPDVRSQSKELAVDAMEDCFEKISLTRVFAVKQLQQLYHEGLVHVLFGKRWVQLGTLQETQKQCIHQLWAAWIGCENIKSFEESKMA